MAFKDLISRLLSPDPRLAALAAAKARRPTWWAMHLMTSPPPKTLSQEAERVRRAFLAPWLAQIEYLSDYADRETRSQARAFWTLVCAAEERFWLEFAQNDTSDWPAGSWPTVRNQLFGYEVQQEEMEEPASHVDARLNGHLPPKRKM